MDRLFDDSFFQPLSSFSTTTLPMDIVDRDNELVVRASVPGFTPEQIEISIQGDVLTLRGSQEQEERDDQENYYLREYRAQNFQRSVRLPVLVSADQATAECKDGILTLRLPKSEESAVQRISIQNGTPQLEQGQEIEVEANK
jgi:HSP20 family protein